MYIVDALQTPNGSLKPYGIEKKYELQAFHRDAITKIMDIVATGKIAKITIVIPRYGSRDFRVESIEEMTRAPRLRELLRGHARGSRESRRG